MKKQFSVLALIVLSTGVLTAQSSKRTTAINALNDYKQYKELDALAKAKLNIDAAAQHPETGVEAKTWKIRGDIYLTSYEHLHQVEDEKQKDEKDVNKRSMVSYENAPLPDLQTAYESFVKAKGYDKKAIYTDDINKSLYLIEVHYDNKGRADYNFKKTADAAIALETAYEISNVLGKPDTSVLNNAALAYRVGGDLPKAKTAYQKLVDMGYGQGKTVSILATLLINDKDTAAASILLSKGRAKYPNDMDLLTTETNLFLMAHKNQEALANLKKVIEKNPNDAQLNLVVASVFDNLANPKDEKGADLPQPADYASYFSQSESYYKKAIELKPEYFDALYNLGVLYNNQAVKIYSKANTIKDAAASAKEGKKADDIFRLALPYLEKAHAINPKDRSTMISLKQLYAKTEQTDKYEKIKAELNAQ